MFRVKIKRKPAAAESGAKYLVPVVQSTFRILGELAAAGGPLSLNEITVRAAVPKSTVFRILSTLCYLGYVVRDGQQRTYHLSRRLAELTNETASNETLRRAALPHMLRLRDLFGETVNLGQLQLDKVVYIEVVPSEYALRLSERPGVSAPVHTTALGKAILAFSPPEVARSLLLGRPLPALTPHTITDPDELLRELGRVRARGYALDLEETMPLANCIAAPIPGPGGTALAAMSLSGPSSRFHPRRDKRLIQQLLKAAEEIAGKLRQTG